MKYVDILEAAWAEHLAPRAADAPTVISTFAGAGGSSLGYSMAGYRELLAVEWDDNAVETFRLNFPGVSVYHGDIAKLSVEECLRLAGVARGELDVLDGSPPCQGFSTAWKRQLDDPRNGLFREYVRLLRGLQPKVFVMENVSGLVKGKMKLIFAEILRELKASGYVVSARLLNAMYFNVPQSRERLIFIGVREDLGRQPSHPKAESRPLTVKEALPGVASIGVKASTLKRWRSYHAGRKRVFYENDTPFAVEKSGAFGVFAAETCIVSGGVERSLCVNDLKRIGSYPDAFLFSGDKWWASIGNSVPPLFMRSIARHIRSQIIVREFS